MYGTMSQYKAQPGLKTGDVAVRLYPERFPSIAFLIAWTTYCSGNRYTQKIVPEHVLQ